MACTTSSRRAHRGVEANDLSLWEIVHQQAQHWLRAGCVAGLSGKPALGRRLGLPAQRSHQRIGLDAERLRTALAGRADFNILTGGYAPRLAQEAIGNVPPDKQFAILEAETGSGGKARDGLPEPVTRILDVLLNLPFSSTRWEAMERGHYALRSTSATQPLRVSVRSRQHHDSTEVFA